MKKQLLRLLLLTAAMGASAQDLLENGDFSDIKNAKSLILKIEVRPGSGVLYFDDITLLPN